MAGRDNPRAAKVGGMEPQHVIIGALMILFVVVNVAVWAAHRVAFKLGDVAGTTPFPMVAAIETFVMDRGVQWSPVATTVLVLETVVVAGVAIAVVVVRRRSSKRRGHSRLNDATRNMASKREIASMSPAARKREHQSKNLPECGWYGAYLGRELSTRQVLMSGTEDHVLNIWAPRQGKTTSKAIPAILNAPGLVVATSCKRDLIDETIDVRAKLGRVWVFDPQNLAPGIEGGFWFDPLDFVRSERYWDGSALRLAEIFEGATTKRAEGGGDNEFFYQQARDLLTDLFLAAAIDRRPITDVYRWVASPDNSEPLDILADSQYGAQYEDLSSKVAVTPRTRDGIFSAAKNCIACLGLAEVRAWMTPIGHTPKLDIADLAADDTATLYLLSKDTNPVARPISTMLTILLSDALEKRASNFARDRLPVPVSMELDEIANVVRWPGLAEALSTYGSRGVLFDIFLQTYQQGVELWGEVGMRKLFSLVSIKVIGPGQADENLAGQVSKQIGTFREIEGSRSRSAGGGSYSESAGQERSIVPIEEVMNLEPLHMIVVATGRRPMVARMVKAEDQDYTDRTRALMAS